MSKKELRLKRNRASVAASKQAQSASTKTTGAIEGSTPLALTTPKRVQAPAVIADDLASPPPSPPDNLPSRSSPWGARLVRTLKGRGIPAL